MLLITKNVPELDIISTLFLKTSASNKKLKNSIYCALPACQYPQSLRTKYYLLLLNIDVGQKIYERRNCYKLVINQLKWKF